MKHRHKIDKSESIAEAKKRQSASRLTPGQLQTLSKKFEREALGISNEVLLGSNPRIPAGYTYLAQFIAHDMGFHRLAQHEMGEPTTTSKFNEAPLLDLSNLYGTGPEAMPELYEPQHDPQKPRVRLKVGASRNKNLGRFQIKELPNGAPDRASGKYVAHEKVREGLDLPRCPVGFEQAGTPRTVDTVALIADPRNDENLLISQITVLFHRAHNYLCDELAAQSQGAPQLDPQEAFATARRMLVHCYQTIIVNDLLDKLLDPEVRERLMQFYHVNELTRADLEIPGARKMLVGEDAPEEFWAAAFRIGHAMIQSHYDIRPFHNETPVQELMELMQRSRRKGPPISDDWVVDLRDFFFDPPTTANDLPEGRNLSHLIALNLTGGFLRGMFKEKVGNDSIDGLMALDLLRDGQLDLPSAQRYLACLRKWGADFAHLSPGDISRRLKAAGVSGALLKRLVHDTPLLIYILAEAEQEPSFGQYLGPLGSRIVGEVIFTSIHLSREPQAKKDWNDHYPGQMPTTMTELLAFAPAPYAGA